MRALINQMVPMSDGVNLATDVWMPDGGGSHPTLLVRTPYYRERTFYVAGTYVPEGYAVAIQDTRGRWGSEGEQYPLVHEQSDGGDTLDWVANQRWCNGRIGMVGNSYLGIVQIPAASCGHEALCCIAPGVAPVSFFRDWIRADGCFQWANAIRWSLDTTTERCRSVLHHVSYEELYRLPSIEAVFERSGLRSVSLQDWLDHDVYDDYWRAVDQDLMYDKVTVPALHIGGWFDHLTRGQFRSYACIRERGATALVRENQRLFVGPWAHQMVNCVDEARRVGMWDFGPGADVGHVSRQQRHIDFWMKEEDNGESQAPPVEVFLMGANRWVGFEEWPPRASRTEQWYLSSGGGARTMFGDGVLQRQTPGSEPPDRYTYDPARPVLTLGGQLYWALPPLGPVDQRPLLVRDDVLVYTSEPFSDPTGVVGELNLDLWVVTDAPDTDIMAKLCVVEPGGQMTVIADGMLRAIFRDGFDRRVPLEKGVPTRLRVHVGNIAFLLPAGCGIALTLTSSDYPRVLPNRNNATPVGSDEPGRRAAIEVLHDAEHPSFVEVPMMKAGDL